MKTLAYLGEMLQEGHIWWCLNNSKHYDQVWHFTKPTLSFTHVSLNPLPDALILKCHWTDDELTWSKRYSNEIPKVFVCCTPCLRKVNDYVALGYIYNFDNAIKEQDFMLTSLIKLIDGLII